MSKYKVDLNADLGEGAGFDKDLIPLLTSANIACGFHAGQPEVMRECVKLCKEYDVNVGAHPSFPDLWGFGRREIKCTSDEVISYILYQLGALSAFCIAEGVKLHHVKPHGAMYNMVWKDLELAKAIAEGVKQFDKDLILFVQPKSAMEKAGKMLGLKVAYEVFADRAYNNDGSLTSRDKENSVLHDEKQVLARTLKMITQSKVTTFSNQEIELQASTICLHGDNPAAIVLAQSLRQGLVENNIEVIDVRSLLES